MLFSLLIVAAQAGSHEVQARKVEGLVPGSYVEVQLVGSKPMLFASDGTSSFACTPSFPASYNRRALTNFAELTDQVGAAVRDGQRVIFDPAMKGIVGTQAESYCNITAATQPAPEGIEGVLGILVVTYNRACFGSAGCNTEKVAVVLDETTAAALSAAMRWAAAQ